MPKLDVEEIEDSPKEETYIQDLEDEIEELRRQVKSLKATQNKLKSSQQESEPSDLNCCEAYKVVLRNFHKLLDEVLPF